MDAGESVVGAAKGSSALPDHRPHGHVLVALPEAHPHPRRVLLVHCIGAPVCWCTRTVQWVHGRQAGYMLKWLEESTAASCMSSCNLARAAAAADMHAWRLRALLKPRSICSLAAACCKALRRLAGNNSGTCCAGQLAQDQWLSAGGGPAVHWQARQPAPGDRGGPGHPGRVQAPM